MCQHVIDVSTGGRVNRWTCQQVDVSTAHSCVQFTGRFVYLETILPKKYESFTRNSQTSEV